MDERNDPAKNLKEFFNMLEDLVEIEPFDNDYFCGLAINWSKKGRGFGQYMLSYNKKDNHWSCDAESDNFDSIAWAIGEAKEQIAKFIIDCDEKAHGGDNDKQTKVCGAD